MAALRSYRSSALEHATVLLQLWSTRISITISTPATWTKFWRDTADGEPMERPLTQNIRPGEEPLRLAEYVRAGGYAAVRKALGSMTPEDVVREVTVSNLRGRGGAGFPTGKKWSAAPTGSDAPHPKYLVVNADEMEPGTFKDRLLMEGDPHQLIEGIVVSAFAVDATIAYIFLRAEYTLAARRLKAAIAEAYAEGYLGKKILGSGFNLELHLHTSAG